VKGLELKDVISDIRTIISQNDAPIKRVGIFGSLVRGEIREESDIDIAVEYDYVQGDEHNFGKFVNFCKACETLSDIMSGIYGRKIDVVEIEEKPGSFIDEIRSEVVWI